MRVAVWLLGVAISSHAHMIDIKPGVFVSGSVREDELVHYAIRVLPTMPAVKVMLIPVTGDADLLLSFNGPYPATANATWVMDEVGVEELLIRRSSDDFCQFEPCVLYMTIVGYETTEYKLVVSHVTSPETIATDSCAPGCAAFDLSDGVCHPKCNVSQCIYDGGDCLLSGSTQLCAPGCPTAWIGDESCDEACFNGECMWDGDDCRGARGEAAEGGAAVAATGGKGGGKGAGVARAISEPRPTKVAFGCADGCMPEWISDGECDEACNTLTCGWDGTDCQHAHSECFADPKGADYRGAIAITEKGFHCQSWAEQFPHQHARTHVNFPKAGLGGHSHCRNPDGEMSPYCFTTDPVMRWDYCDVGSPTLDGGDDAGGGDDNDDDDDDDDDDDEIDEEGEDEADEGPMPERPAAMVYVPGAGALNLASGPQPELDTRAVISQGTSLAAPAVLVLLAILACVGLAAWRRPAERKERGYIMTHDEDFVDDEEEDEEEGEEEGVGEGQDEEQARQRDTR
mmetsp:Transcript_16325/g.38812  ORF Transcript_16325/g.38812 Transcript_16325/m.38812 type:complete len:514 (-) Transcript_16325:336-1877(-)